MKTFGLVGYPLGHSFSKKFFTEKFENEGLADHQYLNFEIDSIDKFPGIFETNPDIIGLNCTIPLPGKKQPRDGWTSNDLIVRFRFWQ